MVSGALVESVRRLVTLALVSLTLVVVVHVLGVRTSLGQSIGDAAYLGRLSESRTLRVIDRRVLEAIDLRVFLLGAVVLLLVAAIRRHWRAGLVITGTFLASILAAELLKAVLVRPVLATEMESLMGQKGGLNTFPSGHSTFVTALVLGLICLSSVRARAWVAIVGVGAIVLITGGVVTAGWHRPSDAFAGIALATIWMSLGAAYLVRTRGVIIDSPAIMRAVPYAAAAVAALGTLIFVLMLAHPNVQGAATLTLVKIIVFSEGAAVVSVFAACLRQIDISR